MAHRQKTSVDYIKKVLDQKDPSNLPMINSYIACNRQELNSVVGIQKMLAHYDQNNHHVRQIHRNITDKNIEEMMSHIYDDRENVNTVDPKELTKMRKEHQGIPEFDTDCDVEYERLIAQEIRERKERGIKVDYTLTIFENLVMTFKDDEEIKILYEMFKLGNKPILRANDWCRPHLKPDFKIIELSKHVETGDPEPEMVRLLFDRLIVE